ncbi:hypothetical protein VDGE_30454 [Verticillium dahliae]|uniref:Uncharacterized protein n=1 Tax=Verticillium dahliae TaxID=27337 RepID=A0A444RXN3_VERDA|nr:hypothetical protein VDGE_30454 [Verticillium dahliae]
MFDENLFLDDLVHHRHQFCSSFLVAAVLLTACQQDAAFNARSFEYIPDLAFECEMSWRQTYLTPPPSIDHWAKVPIPKLHERAQLQQHSW